MPAKRRGGEAGPPGDPPAERYEAQFASKEISNSDGTRRTEKSNDAKALRSRSGYETDDCTEADRRGPGDAGEVAQWQSGRQRHPLLIEVVGLLQQVRHRVDRKHEERQDPC